MLVSLGIQLRESLDMIDFEQHPHGYGVTILTVSVPGDDKHARAFTSSVEAKKYRAQLENIFQRVELGFYRTFSSRDEFYELLRKYHMTPQEAERNELESRLHSDAKRLIGDRAKWPSFELMA